MLSLQHLFREVRTVFGYIDPLPCAVLLRPRLAQPGGQPAVNHAHAVNGAAAVLAPLLRQARGRGLLVPRHEGVNPLRGRGLPARPRGLGGLVLGLGVPLVLVLHGLPLRVGLLLLLRVALEAEVEARGLPSLLVVSVWAGGLTWAGRG